MTNIKDQLERINEQQAAQQFLNRPSLRLLKEKAAEQEVDAFIEKVLAFDAAR